MRHQLETVLSFGEDAHRTGGRSTNRRKGLLSWDLCRIRDLGTIAARSGIDWKGGTHMSRSLSVWLKKFAVLVVLAGAFGCAQKTINDVMADPYRYRNKNVSLTGNVVESYSITGRGFYRIDDSTGRLWVFSTKGVPRKGARVSVKGKIYDGFDGTSIVEFIKLPDAIQERIESGLLLLEDSHRAKS